MVNKQSFKGQMDLNHQRASIQNSRVNDSGPPRYCNNIGQHRIIEFNNPLKQGIELFQIHFRQWHLRSMTLSSIPSDDHWLSFLFRENLELTSSKDILNSLKNPSLPKSGTKDGLSDSSTNSILTGMVNLYVSWSLPNDILTLFSIDYTFPATPRLTDLGPSVSNPISSAISLLIAETSAPESRSAMVLNTFEPLENDTLIIGLLIGRPLPFIWWYL